MKPFALPVLFGLFLICWTTGFVSAAERDEGTRDYIKVEVRGKLNSRVFAIGGETTGIAISANGVTWELDVGKNAALRKAAKELHGKTVIVSGELRVKRGVEVRQRWIVTVATLQPAGADKGNDAADTDPKQTGKYLTDDGKLRHPLVLKDAQGGFAGFNGHIWTIEPNGSWRRQPFLNEKVRPADRKGALADKQLAALAAALARHDLLTLPKQIGKNIGANPHIVTLTFGELQSSIILPPGAPLPKSDPKQADQPAQRFAVLARAMQQLMQTPKPGASDR